MDPLHAGALFVFPRLRIIAKTGDRRQALVESFSPAESLFIVVEFHVSV